MNADRVPGPRGPVSGAARALARLQRAGLLHPARRVEPAADAQAFPGERDVERSVLAPAIASVAAPLLFGAALIVVRGQLESSVSLLMVLPVVSVAIAFGRLAGSIAGVVAAVTFGIVHTEPYYRVTIDDPDDIVETVVLLGVGLAVGYLADRARRSRSTTRARGHELDVVVGYLQHAAGGDRDHAIEACRRAVGALLAARECEWRPNYHGSVGPVLRPDGSLAPSAASTPARQGRSELPSVVEIPVGPAGIEAGRFVVLTDPSVAVSIEERRAAVAVAASLAAILERDA